MGGENYAPPRRWDSRRFGGRLAKPVQSREVRRSHSRHRRLVSNSLAEHHVLHALRMAPEANYALVRRRRRRP
jgi:hypothetical protein